ncbi:hypothetical protein BN1723_000395 [Verticillium longisporum]|uniref:Uncharacterized protein n=1 Tax=Verticillium longisporum TaxID=100787 RepID=A0A0G4LEW5_VERLO|nr:hypothetical protein BN1723_000395 [Verticillium longisporum]
MVAKKTGSSGEALPVRVVTFNVRYAAPRPMPNEKSWQVRCPKICTQLDFITRGHDSPFLCLQEVLYPQLLDIQASGARGKEDFDGRRGARTGGSGYRDDEHDDDATTALSGITAGASDIAARERREKKRRDKSKEKERRRRDKEHKKDKKHHDEKTEFVSAASAAAPLALALEEDAEREAKQHLRSYRHERPARVGGLNAASEASEWDGSTNPADSTVSSTLLSNTTPPPSSRKKAGGIRKVYSTADRTADREQERIRAEARRLAERGRAAGSARRDFSYQRADSNVSESDVGLQRGSRVGLIREESESDVGTRSYRNGIPVPNSPSAVGSDYAEEKRRNRLANSRGYVHLPSAPGRFTSTASSQSTEPPPFFSPHFIITTGVSTHHASPRRQDKAARRPQTLRQREDALRNPVAPLAGPRADAARPRAAKGHDHLWIDTCCIDKTSSAELSEAINSMFHRYEQAAVCYVYLADVRAGGRPSAAPLAEIGASEWFRRGWTLQELLAPKTVEFYDADWLFVGTRTSLQRTISEASSIPGRFLSGESHIRSASVAQRMAWAATRQTTRLEDQAYSLMGLFDVNMPLLYGEGKKAFLRLQQEIMKNSADQSLFAWGKMKTTIVESKDWTIPELEEVTVTSGSYSGLLATTPARFTCWADRSLAATFGPESQD